MTSTKRIPYGVADYRQMREDNGYYVDKTHFIPLLEAAPYYLFFIRPRRFGKTLWLSLLRHYYDVNLKDEFDALFGGTYIGEHSTKERNSYLVMYLNFALADPALRYTQVSLNQSGNAAVEDFLQRYARFFTDDEREKILAHAKIEDRLRQLFYRIQEKQLQLYLFIDDYDDFATPILTIPEQQTHHKLTHVTGFFGFFFNLLKGGTGGQLAAVKRLLITGLSPIILDDVTSGFNIGYNISLNARYNEMCGFTEAEVRAMLTYYHETGVLRFGVEETLALLNEWYNNYCFSTGATTRLFNSDMVLHFLKHVSEQAKLPDAMIDQNARLAYSNLHHLFALDNPSHSNFERLKTIVEHGQIRSAISPGVPLTNLMEPGNFISLLYYYGLLSIDGVRDGAPLLRIPNLAMREVMKGYSPSRLSVE